MGSSGRAVRQIGQYTIPIAESFDTLVSEGVVTDAPAADELESPCADEDDVEVDDDDDVDTKYESIRFRLL